MKENNILNRMCISCRERKTKQELFRIAVKDGKYCMDLNNKVQSRGIYVCKDPKCIEKISKNKKYKIDIELLMQMLSQLKKEKNDVISKLSPFAKSKEIALGIKILREKIWKNEVKLVIIAEDISEKNKEKILSDCIEKNTKYIYAGNKEQLGKLFGKKEVNVIGILDGKIGSGLIKSLGGEPVEGT